MSGKPIDEAVRALADELARASAQEDDLAAGNAYADAAGRVRTLARALTAAQQQGQAQGGGEPCPHCKGNPGLDCNSFGRAAPPSAPVGVVGDAVDVDAIQHILKHALRDGVHGGYTAGFIENQIAALAQQPAAGSVGDTRRMDWLEQQAVEVRKPLRYGSTALFHAEQVSDDDEPHRTDLRAQIDSALATQHQEPKP